MGCPKGRGRCLFDLKWRGSGTWWPGALDLCRLLGHSELDLGAGRRLPTTPHSCCSAQAGPGVGQSPGWRGFLCLGHGLLGFSRESDLSSHPLFHAWLGCRGDFLAGCRGQARVSCYQAIAGASPPETLGHADHCVSVQAMGLVSLLLQSPGYCRPAPD